MRMTSTRIGRFIAKLYPRLPLRRRLLRIATALEGGEMYSQSLRTVLREYHGVSVGDYAYGSLLTPGRSDPQTVIGPYASIGPGVRRFGAAHPLGDLSLHPFWYNPRLGMVADEHDVTRTSCSIGADTWIGADVLILPGCQSIGIGAVVGAGSVVTKDVAPFAIVAGNPAREIGQRLDPEQREALLSSSYWELPPAEAHEVLTRIRLSSAENSLE